MWTVGVVSEFFLQTQGCKDGIKTQSLQAFKLNDVISLMKGDGDGSYLPVRSQRPSTRLLRLKDGRVMIFLVVLKNECNSTMIDEQCISSWIILNVQ